MKFNSKVIVLPVLISAAFAAYAQKLPTVQKTSIRAPSTLKIDGQPAEWGNHFEAYNKAAGVYYTLANDDKNLYLAVQATDETIIRKIVIGGITLTINHSALKDDKNARSITFPKYDSGHPPLFLILNDRPQLTRDTLRNRMQADSFRNAHNQQIASKLKIIGIKNFKGIEGDIISIYNEANIRAASLFDQKIHYTCELAIPLKYLDLDIDNPVKFNYNIKLNGEMPATAHVADSGRPDLITFVGEDGKSYLIGKATPENMILTYPTDFSGEYTLAKK